MSLPAKLPTPPKYCDEEAMTESDWEHYFELRKLRDRYVSDEDKSRLTDLAVAASVKEDKETYDKIYEVLPLLPSVAITFKDFYGIKMIQSFNLYDAKKRYPNDF